MQNVINAKASKKLLPRVELTEIASSDDPSAYEVVMPNGAVPRSYFVKPCHDSATGFRVDGKPKWMGTRFNLFPIVLDSKGTPWAEAAVYITSRLEQSLEPSMSTYHCIAADLAAYLRFVEESCIDWTHFPQRKLERPTYRYRAQLWLSIEAGTLSATTAKRRMSSVISFYRWLKNEEVLTFKNPTWVESDRMILFTYENGLRGSKIVKKTDLDIQVAKQNDPYLEFIEDEGKLRPLPEKEQRWVLEALTKHGHTELTLIQLFSLLTGARIQTVLTFRVKHVTAQYLVAPGTDVVRIPVGPGTGIDTKKNKRTVLHVPTWFIEMLMTYARSGRASVRRSRALGGDTADQYLFLSSHGNPLYESKADAAQYNAISKRRHAKNGQAVRQLIRDYIIPYVRSTYDSNFDYSPHDLRATFGMNLTDEQLKRVAKGEITLNQAREYVKSRMGHKSAATTDGYLQYRGRLNFIRKTNDEYGDHLKQLAIQALGGKV